jgi:SAM-dependent methyltransferase
MKQRMNSPDTTILECPTCRGPIVSIGQGAERVLRCSFCSKQYRIDAAEGFFCFNRELAAQERSLLVHQEPDKNPYMTAFVWPINAARLQQAVRKCRPHTILDIGCGSGEFFGMFKDLCTLYYGLEPSSIPQNRRLPLLTDRQTLIHHDPEHHLPVADSSVDMALFLASYDHIPNRIEVLRDAWRTVRPGGYLLIYMTNYSFWVKRLVNVVTGRQLFKYEEEHFCVHDPRSLTTEVCTAAPGVQPFLCDSDFMFIPNSPLHALYRSTAALKAVNWLLRLVIHSGLHLSDSGSTLISVFQKEAVV